MLFGQTLDTRDVLFANLVINVFAGAVIDHAGRMIPILDTSGKVQGSNFLRT